MADRTKRIFISDIHMGDARSTTGPNAYGWFKNNIPVLGNFLAELNKAGDVKEVVILGDLFDDWIIPADYAPLTSFGDICSNPANKPVIDGLKKLAANPDIKLAYVPGNHDMSMNVAGISETKKFLEATFPNIRFFCNNQEPKGTYCVGTLAAEHGNSYCLFNAPDSFTATNTFPPLGYFISRLVAYKTATTGKQENYISILVKFLQQFLKYPNFIEQMFKAIADDAGLKPGDRIKLKGVPGYPASLTINDISKRFGDLLFNWRNTKGLINLAEAIQGDLENLACAAYTSYFSHFGSNVNIVIFGHTHIPVMDKRYDLIDPEAPGAIHPSDVPCSYIYANSGTWVDNTTHGCTYVETEEVPDSRQHYVRIRQYPGNDILEEGFVGM